jgi:hypothetical protein
MLTGKELIEIFKKSCEKSHKLLIPDSPRQESVADALATHYDSELLEKAVELYVKKNHGPFLIFDFAIESRTIVDKVKFEEEAKNRFRNLVKETHDRLASDEL